MKYYIYTFLTRNIFVASGDAFTHSTCQANICLTITGSQELNGQTESETQLGATHKPKKKKTRSVREQTNILSQICSKLALLACGVSGVCVAER